MPGSKPPLNRTASASNIEDVLNPWKSPRGHENDAKMKPRALLGPDHPADLSRDATPATGSLGLSNFPLKVRSPSISRNMKRGR